MARRVNKTDVAFDITNASKEEIDAISQEVVKNLAERAAIATNQVAEETHDRHYSTHSSDASSIMLPDFDRFRDLFVGRGIGRGGR